MEFGVESLNEFLAARDRATELLLAETARTRQVTFEEALVMNAIAVVMKIHPDFCKPEVNSVEGNRVDIARIFERFADKDKIIEPTGKTTERYSPVASVPTRLYRPTRLGRRVFSMFDFEVERVPTT